MEQPDGFKKGWLRLRVTPRLVIDNDRPETTAKEGLYFDLVMFEKSSEETAEKTPTTPKPLSPR